MDFYLVEDQKKLSPCWMLANGTRLLILIILVTWKSMSLSNFSHFVFASVTTSFSWVTKRTNLSEKFYLLLSFERQKAILEVDIKAGCKLWWTNSLKMGELKFERQIFFLQNCSKENCFTLWLVFRIRSKTLNYNVGILEVGHVTIGQKDNWPKLTQVPWDQQGDDHNW